MTTIEKVKEMILAPSTELKPNEVVDVLNFMFEWKEIDMAYIYRKLGGLKTPLEETMPQEETTPPELKSYAILFKEQLENTLNMGTKEASGYAQLSDYLLCISRRMQILHQVTVKIDAQFQIKGKGKTSSADGSLVAIVVNNELSVPVYVIKYKPRVPSNMEDIEPYH